MTHKYIIFIVSLLIISLLNTLEGQNSLPKVDSTSYNELLGFLSNQGVEIEEELGDIETLLSLSSTPDRQELTNELVQIAPTILSVDHYFYVGDTLIEKGYPLNQFTNFSGSKQLSLAGVPIQANAYLVLEDGKYQADLSSIAVNFNNQDFTQQLREKYLPKHEWNDFINPKVNPLELSEQELESLKKELQYRAYQQIVAHPKFIAYRDKLYEELRQTDSTLVIQYQEIKTKWDSLQTIQNHYVSLWENKLNDDHLNSVREKALEYVTTLKNREDIQVLKGELLEQKLSAKERFLLLTRDLNIGWSVLNDSDFNIKHTTINGIQYAYESERTYASVAYGQQHLPYPDLRFNLPVRSNDRKFLFLKTGIGEAQRERLEVSFLQVSDSIRNRVFQMQGSTFISKQQSLILESTISEYGDFGTSSLDEANAALALKWQWEMEKVPMQIALGYFRVGEEFVTLGNPFLLTNKQGASLDVSARLLKNKLSLRANGRVGKTINEDAQQSIRDWQLLGEANYHFGTQNFISASIIPNVFYQGDYENRLQTQQTIYTLQSNIVSKIGNDQLLSIAQLSNVRSGFEWIDSLQTQQNAYYYLQESYILSSGNSINAGAQFSKVDQLFQLDYQFSIGKTYLQAGGQWTRQYGIKQYGILGSAQIPIGKQLGFQMRFTYRYGDQREFFGNSSLQMQF